MYCSSCGVAVVPGLSYCKTCGAKLNREDGKSSEPKLESLVFGILATFVFGMVAITVLMGVMKAVLGLPVNQVLLITLLPFLLIVLLEVVFIRLLLRRSRDAEEAGARALPKVQATNELDAAQPHALPEARPSVTEHTTRAFDPIYTKRK